MTCQACTRGRAGYIDRWRGRVIDARGRTQIEDKASVRSALGRSPDLAEALMLALGEPTYEPFRYSGLPQIPRSSWMEPRHAAGASCAERDAIDDASGDATSFVNDASHMVSMGRDPRRYASIGRRSYHEAGHVAIALHEGPRAASRAHRRAVRSAA